jgi:hypothetical protein
MKRSLLFATVLMMPVALLAQLPYGLTVLNQPYTPLENATLLGSEQYDDDLGWDDPEFSASLGFDFSFSGYVIDAMDQIGLGSLMLGTTIDGQILLHGVMPTNYDLADRAINGEAPSLIRWETTGDPGNRVFAIEWANAGLYEEVFEAPGSSVSYFNLQVRLFEADNAIEFHYGPTDISSEITDFEPQISGLLLEMDILSENYNGSIYALEGNPTDPTLTPLDGLDAWYYGPALSSYPTDGTVYRFGPTGVTLNLEDVEQAVFTLSPNPTQDFVQAVFEGTRTWTLQDLSGRIVASGIDTQRAQVDMTSLPAGTYLFSLEGEKSEQIIRQ